MKKNMLYQVLMVCCLLAVLPGCGQEETDTGDFVTGSVAADSQEQTEYEDVDIPVAEYTMLSVPEEALLPKNSDADIAFYQDGEVYYIHNEYYEGGGESYLVATAADGSGSSRVLAKTNIRGTYITDYFIDQGGNLYLWEYKYQDLSSLNSERNVYLRKVGADGDELYRADLSSYLSNSTVSRCYADKDGHAAVIGGVWGEMNVYFVNNDGECYGVAGLDQRMGIHDGHIIYIEGYGYYLWCIDDGEESIKLWEMDFQKGTIAEKPIRIMTIAIKGKGESRQSRDIQEFQLLDGGELGLLISTEDVLWQYDFEAREATEIFRWDNEHVELDGRLISWIKFNTAGEVGAGMELYTWEVNNTHKYSNPMLVDIQYVDREQVPERQTVTIGLESYYGDTKNLARRFNRTNEVYRAELVEYHSGELKGLLMYGSTELPDLLEVTGLKTEWLESKNLLEDLTPYFERSNVVSKEDILPSVLELLGGDGKIPGMATCFTIRSLITAADIMEEGLSMEEGISMEENPSAKEGDWDYDRFLELGNQYPDSWYFDQYDAVSVWGAISTTALGDFIDWEEGKCSFDSMEFKELLEKVKSLAYPAEQGKANKIDLEKLMSQQVLFQNMFYGSPYDYDMKMRDTSGKIKSIGFPSTGGDMVFLFNETQKLAIYGESPNKEGAWAFLEFLLSEREQSWYSSENNAFPVRIDAFEAYLTKYHSAQYEMYFFFPVEEGTPEKLRYMAEHLGVNQNDSDISVIVMEELRAYFAGHKTVDEATEVIQNRAQLYLDEMQK